MRDEDETLGEQMARIEAKLDSALEKLGDHESRIRRSEYTLWSGAGVVAAASAFFYKIGFHS